MILHVTAKCRSTLRGHRKRHKNSLREWLNSHTAQPGVGPFWNADKITYEIQLLHLSPWLCQRGGYLMDAAPANFFHETVRQVGLNVHFLKLRLLYEVDFQACIPFYVRGEGSTRHKKKIRHYYSRSRSRTTLEKTISVSIIPKENQLFSLESETHVSTRIHNIYFRFIFHYCHLFQSIFMIHTVDWQKRAKCI